MESVQDTLAECGMDLDVTSSGSVQTSLQRIHDECDDMDIAHVGTCPCVVRWAFRHLGQLSGFSEPTLHKIILGELPF